MTYPQLQQEILSCIWSAGLKQHIENIGYTFTEEDLLGIAYHFAPNFQERLRLLQLLVDGAPAVADHASRCIAWQKTCLEQFCRPGDHEIYELQIQDEPGECEDRYLCASFETALEMIDQFRKEYDFAPETEFTRYTIEKRRILQPGETFREDDLNQCILGAGKCLISVDTPSGETENGACPHACADCANPCVMDLEVCFPSHISDRSAVRYRLSDGSLHYGIHFTSVPDEITDSYYIIPLDGEMLKHKTMDDYWDTHDHEHIPCPYADAVSVSALPAELQENYRAFLAWMDTRFGP